MILQVLMAQGIDRHRQGDLSGAELVYRQVLAKAPRHRDALHMLAVICAQQGRREEAGDLFRCILDQNVRDPLVLTNYANLLRELGRDEAALELLEAAIALDPKDAERWNSLALAQMSLGELEAALASATRALSLRPDHGGALRSHADILQSLGEYGQALAAYDQVLALEPNDAGLWNNRGLSLRNLGQLEASFQSFRRAKAIDSQLAAAPFNIGLNFLLAGDFARGLPLYEWRKKFPHPIEDRNYDRPLWTGAQDLAGKRLIAYVEQGLGDAIQFFRFVKLAEARGASVTLSVFEPLMRLLAQANPACELVGWGKVPSAFDYHIPLMSLPLALGISVETIPAPRRYLAAESERVARWSQRIGSMGFRIGIAWRGNKAVLGAEGKEFPLSALSVLGRISGVRLISLQKDVSADEVPHDMTLERFEDLDRCGDAFLDSSAVIENLDLVISADTAIAHLAGALGAPVWVGLKHVPDWRWLLNRSDSPWYPTMKLFRQKEPGNWSGVVEDMQRALIVRLQEPLSVPKDEK